MKKTNLFRSVLSAVLAVMMIVSLPLSVFATTVTEGTVDVETTAGKNETIDVNITINETTNPDGSTTVQSTTKANDVVTDDGLTVDYSAKSDITTDAEGMTTGTESSQYTSSKPATGYVASGGSSTVVGEQAPNVNVEIPTTSGESNTTSTGNTSGTSTTTGDTDKSDGKYDYTTETVIKEGSATVTTDEITVSVNTPSEEYKEQEDLEFTLNETDPNANNDLSSLPGSVDVDNVTANVEDLKDGYQFIYAGDDDFSQYWAGVLYTKPQVEGEVPIYVEKDENGNVIQEYYCGRLGKNGKPYAVDKCYYVEGMYKDGEKINEDKIPALWSTIQNFVLVDPETGKVVTTYCADHATPTQDGFSYKMENVEDAEYYSEEQAAMIRTVAKNGYWGATDGDGSLESVKNMMREAVDENGNRVFTDEEVNSLTDGVAMSATQYAIWTYSNAMSDIVFVNAQYIPKDENNVTDLGLINTKKPGGGKYTWRDFLLDVPAEKQDSVDLLFKLYNHLITMDPTPIEEKNSTNTVYSADNFIDNMDVTVVKKDEKHANNKDTNKDNDAYVTNLSFALVVTPSTANGDDMIVRVLDTNGNPIAEARIAGTPKEGETMQYLQEVNGNYVFENITMVEGEQNFNITLEGIQNLETGVYLYTSEVRVENEQETSSQTFVGLAGGSHAVNVSMNISFSLDVQDEVVAKERVWRTQKTTRMTTPPPHRDPPEGEEEIPDEEVPLADAPETGDATLIYGVMSAISGMGLAALNITGNAGKKKARR